MNKLRIGMVTLCYKPTINGVVRMIDLYKERYEALGHEVTIFTLGKQNKTTRDVIKSIGMPLGKTGYFANGFMSRAAQTQMAQMDILHCHHLFMTMAFARRYGRCPIVYTNHTRYDLYAQHILSLPNDVLDPLMKKYWQIACRQADVVVAPSQSINQFLSQVGINQPIVTVENGIDAHAFLNPTHPKTKAVLGLPETAVLLTYVGRLSKEENLNHLITQFQQLLVNHPDTYLMLIGNGPEQERLQKRCQASRLTKNVRFLGSVANYDLPNYLAAADLFVTASQSEVHPLTLLEAMAAGLPVVAYDAPGNRDIVVHQKTGMLVQQDDALASGIDFLLTQPSKRREMGVAARHRSQQFTIEKTVQKTLDVYQKLLNHQPDLVQELSF